MRRGLLLIALVAGLIGPSTRLSAGEASSARFAPEFKSYMSYNLGADIDGDRVNTFYVDKVYLGGRFHVDDGLSFRARLEFAQGAALIKYAYMDLCPAGGLNQLVFGIHPDPYYCALDAVWRLRFVRRFMSDDRKASPNTDMGVMFVRKFRSSCAALRLTNGEGHKTPEDDVYKAWQVALSLRPGVEPERGFGFDVTAIVNGEDVGGAREERNACGALLSYGAERWRVGLECVATGRGYRGGGWSAYIVGGTGGRWEGFLRFDSFDPDTGAPADVQRLSMAGVCAKARDGLRTAFSWQRAADEAKGGADERLVLSMELKW